MNQSISIHDFYSHSLFNGKYALRRESIGDAELEIKKFLGVDKWSVLKAFMVDNYPPMIFDDLNRAYLVAGKVLSYLHDAHHDDSKFIMPVFLAGLFNGVACNMELGFYDKSDILKAKELLIKLCETHGEELGFDADDLKIAISIIGSGSSSEDERVHALHTVVMLSTFDSSNFPEQMSALKKASKMQGVSDIEFIGEFINLLSNVSYGCEYSYQLYEKHKALTEEVAEDFGIKLTLKEGC